VNGNVPVPETPVPPPVPDANANLPVLPPEGAVGN
jgi:hypothetical protein